MFGSIALFACKDTKKKLTAYGLRLKKRKNSLPLTAYRLYFTFYISYLTLRHGAEAPCALSFAEEVECFVDFFLGGCLIDGDEFIDMWLEFYDKMTDDDKNILPLKRIAFSGNND